ncbi:MAG: acylneuraminate cytidylyltransferase family protein [Lachnospiraceae bacterium]|nr:acylneuraminate cytidylyltransferase family protein [Lachnospiraceae bacterium]
MEILAVIPARAGSKSVPHKNIREIGGKPMLAHSIDHAKASTYINRVIVSTDSKDYAEIAKEYGAEVPFLRPAEYATDTALDYDVFYHALTWLKENDHYIPDVVVQLRPTYPIRRSADIDNMVELLLKHPEADSVRSMTKATEIPYKMWLLKDISTKNEEKDHQILKDEKSEVAGQIIPLMKDIPECYNMPRQQLPTVYYQNACIDVFRPEVVLEKHSMSGDCILGYEMRENYDIDTEEDFERVIRAMK